MIQKLWIASFWCLILLLTNGSDCNKSTNNQDTNLQPGDYYVDIYDASKTFEGTTLFTDSHDAENLRVVEVDMDGNIVWEFVIPQNWMQGSTVGLDAERLDNGNILLVISNTGLFEIDRTGQIIWSHPDPDCSHDADRLANGNTIYVFGNNDTKQDAQVKEVNAQGQTVWSWFAKNNYDVEPYADQARGGWSHINAVTRMSNDHTLISARNFDLTIEVDIQGTVVWEYNWLELYDTTDPRGFDPHEPEIHTDNTLIVCLQWETPFQIVEIDKVNGNAVWEYFRENLRTARDADKLPNGNVLVVGVMEDLDESVIFEVTPDKEIVWQLRLFDTPVAQQPGHFYKAQRIAQNN